jgi:hypothetical protein
MTPKSLVPAYIWEGNHRQWTRLLQSSPDAIVVNPNNGPATRPTAQFCDRVRQAHERGIAVFGYVAMGWLRTASNATRVARHVERWSNVGDIAGMFFDEVPTTPSSRIEKQLADVIDHPLGSTVLNPGTHVPEPWFGYWPKVTFCTFEGSAAAYMRTMPSPGPRHRQGALVYGCLGTRDRQLVIERATDQGLGWATATTGRRPNPWSTIPADTHKAD